MARWLSVSFVLSLLQLVACASSPDEPHPGVAQRWGRFLSMPHQRAFAIAGDPNGSWVGATVGGYISPIDAERAALRECENEVDASPIEGPCEIYATGHRIVWPESSPPSR